MGLKKCCVEGCLDKKSRRRKFPVCNEELYNEWLRRVNNSELFNMDPQKLYRKVFICDSHFGRCCKSENTRLLNESLPTINLPGFSEECSIKNSFFYYWSGRIPLPGVEIACIDTGIEPLGQSCLSGRNDNVQEKKPVLRCVKSTEIYSEVTDTSVDNALESTSTNNATSTAEKIDDGTSNLIKILADDSEPTKITPKIVDVRTVPDNTTKVFHIKPSNTPKTYEKKIPCSFTVKNDGSVSGTSTQQRKASTSNQIVVDQAAFKILLSELSKNKSDNQIDDEIQIVEAENPVIDLCDNESRDNTISGPLRMPIDSNFNTNQDTQSSANSKLFFLTQKNMSTICRVCLKEKDVLKLSENNYDEKTYAELLELCSAIKLEEDPSLSQNICPDCAEELLQAYKFRQKCSSSEQTLANFKAELARSEERNKSIFERKKNLTLRFHDYDHTLGEEDVQSITKPIRQTPQKGYRKRFYLVKGGLGDKKSVKFKEIDEANAKNLLNRNSVPIRVGNTLCNIAAGVLPPGHSLDDVMKDPTLKNTLIRNLNKRKMMAYTRVIRPAISNILTPSPALRKKPKVPRKRKRNPDQPPKPKDKKLVVPGICEICQEPYNTVDEYKQHAKATKHYLNTYVCQYCEKIFPDRHRLKMHVEINHEKTKAHMCEKCGQCFSTQNYLFIHQKKHSKTDYICKVCKASFTTLKDVVRHKKALHKTEEKKNHCCEFCGDFFAHSGTLRHHRNRVHLKIKQQFCQICDKGYQYKSSLKKHMITHSTLQYDCKLCNKTFKKENRYLEHIKTQHPGTNENTKEEDEIQELECNYCEKVCRNKQLYSMHIREDHEGSVCIYCDTLYESAEDLDDHIKAAHDDIPDFSCRYCGKCYPESHTLFSHLDNHRARFYQCNLCFKRFPNTFRLKVHMYMHTREKVYECQYCDKAFQYSSSRVIHERLHTGERPYVCDVCGKGCVCSSSYKRHRRTHILPSPINEGEVNETEIRDDNMEIYQALAGIEEVPEKEQTVTILGH